MDTSILLQSILNGLMAGWIYVLVALGLSLILSIMGIVQLAHGEMYMIGAYATFFFFNKVGMNFFLSIVLAACTVAVLGVFLYKSLFQFVQRNEERSIIVAIGLIMILQKAVTLIAGGETKVISSPFKGVLTLLGTTLSWERLIVVITSIVFVTALILFIKWTKNGQAMLAVSQDLEIAALQGVNVQRVSSIAMFLGSGMAAVAGALMGALFSISTSMGGFALMKGIAVVILGGLGSIPGAIIGGLILGLVDGIVPVFLSTQMASMLGFIIVILFLIFRPQGIMGHE